ncbi:MAG: thioredoxin domain-containing protein [Chloroflexota bacterium]
MTQSGRTPPTRKERRAAERASGKTPTAAQAAKPGWQSPVVLISVGVVIVVVVIIAIIALMNSQQSSTPIREAGDVTPADLQDGTSLGDPNAPVVIDLYEDPQCPVCGRFNKDLEPLLISTFIKDGTVRLNYKDFVFIGNPGESLDAAVGMLAAEQLAGKFWAFHDIVYANQNGENKGGFSRDRLAQMAVKIGLDKDAFLKLLDDPALIKQVNDSTDTGKNLGVDSTPTLIVNGQLTPGLPSWDQLSQVIEQAAAAKASTGASPAP